MAQCHNGPPFLVLLSAITVSGCIAPRTVLLCAWPPQWSRYVGSIELGCALHQSLNYIYNSHFGRATMFIAFPIRNDLHSGDSNLEDTGQHMKFPTWPYMLLCGDKHCTIHNGNSLQPYIAWQYSCQRPGETTHCIPQTVCEENILY